MPARSRCVRGLHCYTVAFLSLTDNVAVIVRGGKYSSIATDL